MIHLPNEIGREDISQWLSGGVFFVEREAGSLQMAQFLETTVGGIHVMYKSGKHDGDTGMVRRDKVFPHWPQCGAVNMRSHAAYVVRRQRRQWRRTYNGRCVDVYVLGKWSHIDSLLSSQLDVDCNSNELLEALFRPVYPATLTEAAAMLTEIPSVALTPQITLVGGHNSRVYYRRDYVGRLAGAEFYPKCDNFLATRVSKLIGGLDI